MRIIWEAGDHVQIRGIQSDTIVCADAVVIRPEADGYILIKDVATGAVTWCSSKCVEPRDPQALTPRDKATSDYLSKFPLEARAYCLRAYEDGFLDGVLETVEP